MIDIVHPLKMEDSETGGTENDQFPTALDPHEDFVGCRGVAVQNATSKDEAVQVTRNGDELVLMDAVAGSYSLSAVVSGGFDINKIIWDNVGGIVYANDEAAVTKL